MSRKLSLLQDANYFELLNPMTKKERHEYIKRTNNSERKVYLRTLIKNNE